MKTASSDSDSLKNSVWTPRYLMRNICLYAEQSRNLFMREPGSHHLLFSIAVMWQHDETGTLATLGGGKIAEIVLKPSKGMDGKSAVLHNVRYLGAPRNDGLVIMPNEVEAYRIGDNAFEFRGTTGFMTTVDVAFSDYQ